MQITNVPVANIITTKPLTIPFIMLLIFICINPLQLVCLISSKFLRFPVSNRICSCADDSRHTCLSGICMCVCKLCTGYLSTESPAFSKSINFSYCFCDTLLYLLSSLISILRCFSAMCDSSFARFFLPCCMPSR